MRDGLDGPRLDGGQYAWPHGCPLCRRRKAALCALSFVHCRKPGEAPRVCLSCHLFVVEKLRSTAHLARAVPVVQIWIPAKSKWVHADPCENKLGKPLMYEQGWNKRLSYVIAFDKNGAVDVTRR